MKPPLDQTTFEQGFWRLFGKQGDGGEEYLHLWSKLVLFFKEFPNPEELADEVLDRMIRKAAQEEIENKLHYARRVARYVRLEALKKNQVLTSFEGTHIERREEGDALEREIRLQILEECLEELSWDDREILRAYYQYDKVEKIELRRKLAAERAMSISTLRVKACRLRIVLAKKIKGKMERYSEYANYLKTS